MSLSRRTGTSTPDGTTAQSETAQSATAQSGMNQGMRVLSYLISGIALYGAVGWGADHLLGTRFLLPVGLVVGAALAMYLVIKRFGSLPPTTAPGGTVDRTRDKGRV